MSFTSEIKKEICKEEIDAQMMKAQLCALFQMRASLHMNWQGMYLSFQTENATIAKHVFQIMKTLYDVDPRLSVLKKMQLKKNNIYRIQVFDKAQEILEDLQILTDSGLRYTPSVKMVRSEKMARAYLQGCFLASGSINSPKSSNYHLEMSSQEKEETMDKFSRHELDILVSTTVIEVGIDVANASVMVIYDAHRFGLSTLHQLRGRVARDKKQGYCYLLSASSDPQAIERLKKMEELKDGFEVSNYDLHMRGPGDILGIRQSGMPCLVFGDFEKDQAMMEMCIHDAKEIIQDQVDVDLLLYISKAIENAQYFD